MEKKRTGSVTDLTQGVIWRQLVLFALPFLLSNLLQQFYSTADAAIVGQSVGAGALAEEEEEVEEESLIVLPM